MERKILIYNEPGWELMQKFTAPASIRQIEERSVNLVAESGVSIYQLSLLTGHIAAVHRSHVVEEYCSLLGEPYKMNMWRLRETMRSLASQDTDVLEIVTNRCHELGIECHASIRINDAHHTYHSPQPHNAGTSSEGSTPGVRKTRHEYIFPDLRSPWMEANRDLWLSNGGAFDFAQARVRERKIAMIREVLANYDVDGIDLDFTRFRPFFEQDYPMKIEVFNQWVAQIRALIDDYSLIKGHPIKLTARIEYDNEVNLSMGVDIAAWVKAGYIDIVQNGVIGDATPDASVKWLVNICRGSKCKVCPGLEGFFYWVGHDFGTLRNLSIENARAAASNFYLDGADGIQLFNLPACETPWDRNLIEELAYPQIFQWKDKHYVYTMWDGAIMCKETPWDSKLILSNQVREIQYHLAIGDDLAHARSCGMAYYATLHTRIDGLNRKDDIELRINDYPLTAREATLNQFAWDSFSVDRIDYDIPYEALNQGENLLQIKKLRDYQGYNGVIEFQEIELTICYEKSVRNTRLL
jgi:hypothetical protein